MRIDVPKLIVEVEEAIHTAFKCRHRPVARVHKVVELQMRGYSVVFDEFWFLDESHLEKVLWRPHTAGVHFFFF